MNKLDEAIKYLRDYLRELEQTARKTERQRVRAKRALDQLVTTSPRGATVTHKRGGYTRNIERARQDDKAVWAACEFRAPGHSFPRKDITKATGLPAGRVGSSMRRLVQAHKLERMAERGWYRIPS